MRCLTCNYRLWNIPSRQCPECGTEFLPSRYEFAPNAVEFCCPHCEQPYYGTGLKGHLTPSAFDCAKCGRAVGMDEMVLRPAAGVEEEQTGVERLPWPERNRRGFFRAWLATVWMAMVAPSRVPLLLPEDRTRRQAWGFMLLTNGATLGLGMMLPIIGVASFFAFAAAGGRGSGVFGFVLGLLIAIVATFALSVIFVLLWAAVTHGIARRTGGERRFGDTAEALCYSNGPNIISAVPCLGVYLFVISAVWVLVSAVFMVRTTHKISGWRAALATLTFPVLTAIAVVGLYSWFIYSVMTSISPTISPGSGWVVRSDTKPIGEAITAFASDTGVYPAHAIELVDRGYLVTSEFVPMGTLSVESGIKVGSVGLDRFTFLNADAQRKAVGAAVAGIPDDTVAHRLGDFVFTYHGADPATADPGLWLVIGWPDPDQNGAASPGWFVTVGTPYGQVAQYPSASFAQDLAQQNRLRAAAGLSPIPHPRTVRHGRPARASSSGPDGEQPP